MELSVGEVIYRLRKEKGVTQEALANSVGVSVAAVSKWESKNSYPDITILPSIARFFNTTIDKLLSYEIEITNEEVMEIAKKCASLFEKDTVENSIKKCEGYIKEYPNNMFLKFRIGSLYMMSISGAKDEEEAEILLNKAIELLEESTESEDQEISEASKTILSSLYAMNDEYDKAEEIILSLPQVTNDRDDILVGLYINQKKNNEAIKLLRNLTYKKLSRLIMALDSYISLFLQNANLEKCKEVLSIQDKLIEVFGVEPIYGVSNNLTYAHIYSKEKNREKTLEHFESIIENLNKDISLDGHLLFDNMELFEGIHSKNYLIGNIKKLIIDDKYDFVKEEERYKEIVNKLEELI